jgi:hypothetical protein
VAEKTVLVCDVCGEPAATTVKVETGRRNYLKDLCRTPRQPRHRPGPGGSSVDWAVSSTSTALRPEFSVADGIPPGGEIGEETHDHVDQVLVFVAGAGEASLNGARTLIGPGRLVAEH